MPIPEPKPLAAYPPKPESAILYQHRHDWERPTVLGEWAWSVDFGRWSRLVTFKDGWHGYSYACHPGVEMIVLKRQPIWFWEFLNDSFVKLKLAPGQSREHYCGSRDEEGCSSQWNRWTFDAEGGQIVNEFVQEGRDCDGRSRRAGTLVCPLNQLFSLKADAWKQTHMECAPFPARPRWQTVDLRQRDHSAEMAGY
jgi:hypothetical protein